MSIKISSIADSALNTGEGILRLVPNWVPRSFCIPGRRMKLHPDDYYAMGGVRIVNASQTEPLVMLKHFGSLNSDLMTESF